MGRHAESTSISRTASRKTHTDDDFTGFGHRGDLLLVVTNADAYAAEIGRRTIRYIINNLAGKLAEGEQLLAMSAGQLEAELTDV